ncbi:MAG TPA: hypothetical protein PLH11_07085, partial [Gemmobacter sp.]|nr:hypothetical protein [Gemmobacter sp.]
MTPRLFQDKNWHLPVKLRGVFFCLLVLGAAAQPHDVQARDVTISLSDAREAAVQAVSRGELATAEALARHLLTADPQDPLARQVLATVALRQRDLPKARTEARAAHANARTDRQR